jgi:hypothetical protein
VEPTPTVSFLGPPQVVEGTLLSGSRGFGVSCLPDTLLRVSVSEGDLLRCDVPQQVPRDCVNAGLGEGPRCQLDDRLQFLKPSE